MKQTAFNTGIGVIGAIVSFAFGGWSELLIFFLITIGVDYVTGIAASVADGKGLSSRVGFVGLLKKVLMLVVIFLAHRMDQLMGMNVIMTGSIYFYLANEFISITENYGRLGLPLPSGVKQIIQVLKDRGQDNNG